VSFVDANFMVLIDGISSLQYSPSASSNTFHGMASASVRKWRAHRPAHALDSDSPNGVQWQGRFQWRGRRCGDQLRG
jgi:hypothetical protein